MVNECSLKKATVPELISQSRALISAYATSKDQELLRDVSVYLDFARRLLMHALVAAGLNNRRRIESIQAKQREIDEIKNSLIRMHARR